MNKTYNPKEFEDKIYKMWQDKNHFRAEVDKDKNPFSIILPPPNITSHLHEGHALMSTLQDIIIRVKRMQGYSTLWLPGTDHASIATEVKVLEKIYKDTGKLKTDLTREEFLKEAWDWKNKYSGTIIEQLKKLGNSCDWSRLRFTMDEGCNEAVTEMFVKLYNDGYIYRGNRLINWCPDCKTSLSDAEVEHVEKDGGFYHLKYYISGEDNYVVVATTRPETIFGDVALAFNTNDKRRKDLEGKKVIVPLVNKEIPIIFDEGVELDKGTGALKVTPGTDILDYEIGKRHSLEELTIFTDDAKLNELAGKYKGLKREEAKKIVVNDLKELELLEKVEVIKHSVGGCYRCSTSVEPMLKEQWFVKMKNLSIPALKVAEDGGLKFVPDRFVKIYNHWLENIRDWCISRQLWWGHRIPAYYCNDCSNIMVSKNEIKKCDKCSSVSINQDEDVLDTWFSSALWPFSTLGWPNDTEDFKYFYPTNVLVTGYDIIFFWVVRMVFSSLYITDKSPFERVLINGLVRDNQGRKISKSLDNGTDPLDIIDKYGADALRFMLISGTSSGNDTRFSIEKVERARNIANKLWNASRFIITNMEEKEYNISYSNLDLADKWILSELNSTKEMVNELIEKLELGYAADEIVNFIWNKFCDWYIELSKSRMYSDDLKVKDDVLGVLIHVLKESLKLLHPFMPFITEEIWQHLTIKEDLIVSKWPEAEDIKYDNKIINQIMEIIKKVRNIRTELDISPKQKGRLFIKSSEENINNIISNKEYIMLLSGISDILKYENEIENSVSIITDDITLYMPLDEFIDYQKEVKRLKEELKKAQSELKRAKGKLSNEGFVNKAPKKLIDEENEKIEKYLKLIEELDKKILELEKKI